MARDPKQLRKAYEYKLGKDLASKLDDKQISSLSKYYNSLPPDQQSKVDSELIKGMGEFLDTARMMAGMQETELKGDKKFTPNAKPKSQGPMRPPKEKGGDVYSARKSDKEIKEDIPEGLDDLLKDIKTETSTPKTTSKKPDKKAVTALVKKFSGEKKEDTEQLANETIDPKVLRLLGLEDTFDLDYDTYKTLLREKMAAGRMSKSQIPTEETELLTNEFKRVKNKTGRFKPTKKKVVNISKVLQSGKKYNKSAVNTQKLLSGSKETESNKIETKGKAVTDSFENINQTLVGIDSLLADILGEEKKESEQEAKTARKADQKAEEEKSEKSAKKKATTALKGFKAPKMGFLDMIKRFFKNILLGGFVLKILDWIKNPENQKKIQEVVTFITDNLDKILLGIAAIVGIGIGAKILSFLTLFTPLVSGLLVVLKGLLGLLMGPAGLIALLVAGIFAATAASKEPIEDLIRDNFKRTYGEEYADEGAFITKLGDQYGRIASTKDRERLLSDEEKQSAFYIDQYDNALKERKKLSDQIERDEKTLATTKDKRSRNAASKRLQKNKPALIQIELKIKTLKDQISIGGKSLEQLQQEFTEGLILPQTGLSKELYPTAGTGAEMSGVPRHFGKGAPNTGEGQQTSTPQTPIVPSSDGSVKKIIFGAGHAEDPNRPGSMLGTDGRPVQGTADDGSSGLNTPANATGVTESQLSRFVVDNLKKEVEARGLTDKIGFRDIYSWDGLRKVPQEVESTEGHQYVDIHADARGFGKAGVLPSANESATDRSLMKEFGRYSESFKPSSKGVTAGGGTLLEIGAIDDPKLRSLLLEAKSGNAGPATQEMINKILRGVLPSVGPKIEPVQKQEPPRPPNTDQASAVLPLSGGGAGGDEIASASVGRNAAASFSSKDGNNSSPILTSSIFNLMAV